MLNLFKRPDSALKHAAALARMSARHVDIATIIDVGAAKGDWTKMAQHHWPNTRAHLLEAKESWRAELAAFQKQNPNISFEVAGVTREPGVIYFPKTAEQYGGAVFSEVNARDDLEEINATSIDHETSRLDLKGPFAIKLDTHGTEIDILDGAASTLKETAFLCIETYNIIGQKRFPQLILDLEARGFRCADVAEPLFRPGDKLLWQIDFYFMRADHSSFQQYGFLP